MILNYLNFLTVCMYLIILQKSKEFSINTIEIFSHIISVGIKYHRYIKYQQESPENIEI